MTLVDQRTAALVPTTICFLKLRLLLPHDMPCCNLDRRHWQATRVLQHGYEREM